MGENIADVAGLAMAYRAWQVSLRGKPAPVIDGYTGEQRFFIGWAQGWARKYRDDELRRRLLTDPHSPSEYRTNNVVSNSAGVPCGFRREAGRQDVQSARGPGTDLVRLRRRLCCIHR